MFSSVFDDIVYWKKLKLFLVLTSQVRHGADIKSDDVTNEGKTVINLQAGYNKGANQTGMSFGAVRHGGDIKVPKIVGHEITPLQSGTNTGANQRGMTFGGVRHGADIRVGRIQNLVE